MELSQEPQRVQISFGDGFCEELLGTFTGPNLVLLHESSVFENIHFNDVVEIERDSAGGLRFLSVAQRSNLSTFTRLISPKIAESESFNNFLRSVVNAGGNGERVFGGYLMLHLPQDSEAVMLETMDEVIRSIRDSGH